MAEKDVQDDRDDEKANEDRLADLAKPVEERKTGKRRGINEYETR